MTSKLLAIIAAGILFSGCASDKILRKGDKFREFELFTVYSGKICNKPYYEVNFRDKEYNHYYAQMKEDGIGVINLGGADYNIKIINSRNPDERGIILAPAKKK